MRIVNLSGHPLDAPREHEMVASCEIPNVDPTDVKSVTDAAETLAEAYAPHEGSLVVLPGLSSLAAITLAKIHGRTGSFPMIAWAIRVDGKFVLTGDQSIDLHEVRLDSRMDRMV